MVASQEDRGAVKPELSGEHCKIHDLEKYGSGNAVSHCQQGYKDGQTVTVLAFDHGYVTIRDANGREWEVCIININSGWDERVVEKWRERKLS